MTPSERFHHASEMLEMFVEDGSPIPADVAAEFEAAKAAYRPEAAELFEFTNAAEDERSPLIQGFRSAAQVAADRAAVAEANRLQAAAFAASPAAQAKAYSAEVERLEAKLARLRESEIYFVSGPGVARAAATLPDIRREIADAEGALCAGRKRLARVEAV
jgi:hypothetical protein